MGSTLIKKALALLVAKALKTSRFFLFVSCVLVVKALTMSGLLVLTSSVLVMTRGLPSLISGALVKVLLATIWGPPQLVYCPLPILVCALQDAASLTNNWGLRRQQPHGLMVLAIGAIKPIFVASISRGVVHLIRAEQPVRGARGGGGVTICVAANPRDWWGSSRAGANEPAVIHRSSFVEEEGGNGLGSLLLVPM